MLCTQHPDGLRGSLLEEVAGVGPVGRKRQLGRLWRPRAGPNSWESGAAKGHECLEAPMEGGGGVRGPPFMEEICASLAPIHRPADPKCAHRGDKMEQKHHPRRPGGPLPLSGPRARLARGFLLRQPRCREFKGRSARAALLLHLSRCQASTCQTLPLALGEVIPSLTPHVSAETHFKPH